MSGATNKITALYCRLSQEDARLGESLSIENQKAILLEYAKKNHFPNPVFFVDDGYSGTNYDRPGFQSMLAEIEAGRVGIVITKDLSRLGRNSALTGLYTNFTFPQYGVRYIAINDNYDTIDPNSVNNDFAGIKNWFNEFYARDTSRKIRAVQKAKGERGVRGTPCCTYRYRLWSLAGCVRVDAPCFCFVLNLLAHGSQPHSSNIPPDCHSESNRHSPVGHCR